MPARRVVAGVATQDCDGCGRSVRIAGGVDDLWTFDAETSKGLTLELTDGSEHFLCFDCVAELPDDRDPTAEDVAELAEQRNGPDADADDGDADAGDAADSDETADADTATDDETPDETAADDT